MRTKTKKLAALVMSGVMTLSIAAPVAVQADDKVELTGMVQQSRWYSGLQNMVEKLEEDENISISPCIDNDTQLMHYLVKSQKLIEHHQFKIIYITLLDM